MLTKVRYYILLSMYSFTVIEKLEYASFTLPACGLQMFLDRTESSFYDLPCQGSNGENFQML